MTSQFLHRGVFSWPSKTWINRDKITAATSSQFSPADLGLELTENSHEVEMEKRISKAKAVKTDESIYLFDMDKTINKYFVWRKYFPRIRPFYAIKAYDDPCVISLLDHLGAGFDCASKMEMDLVVRQLKIKPENVVYANTVKAGSHLVYAAKLGVDLMTFDNEEELYKIKKDFPMARLLMRLRTDGAGSVQVAILGKSGCRKENVPRLCDIAKALDLNLIGVSFHIGSGCNDSGPYVEMIQEAGNAFRMAENKGFRLQLLDIGGGFFGDYNGEEYLKEMSGPINTAIEDTFPLASGVTIISEPGRYLVESGLTVAACVIGKRVKEIAEVMVEYEDRDQDKDAIFEYFLSESIHGLFRNYLIFHGSGATPLPIKAPLDKGGRIHQSVLWGNTCNARDKITTACFLPEMDIGDWLVFLNLGAYSVTDSSEFNGFQLQPVQRTITKEMWNSIFKEVPHEISFNVM